jgi:hypothetical protein
MDLLFHRYASPFLLLDQLIPTGDLSDFISTIWEIREEEMQWQYFLSKVFDKSFEDFKETMKPQQGMTQKEIETTINDSMSMMNTFIPE